MPAAAAERAAASFRATPAPSAVPGQVIVRHRGDGRAARTSVSGRRVRGLGLPGLELLALPPGADVAGAVAALNARSDVAYAQPNRRYAVSGAPNDTNFGLMWGLQNTGQTINGSSGTFDADIDAPEAWDVVTGGDTPVAVVDTGVDLTHTDLAPNIWSNPGETGTDAQARDKRTNGVDDDANGKIDDWRGWDWIGWDNNPSDAHGHGTHVAGTVAARGNNSVGVAGVSWTAKIVPLRVLDADGYGSDADIAEAFAYAGQLGVKVVNASLGGGGYSSAMRDAIASAPNTLFVFAAGNAGSDNDVSPTYPCSYTLANIVCVAATDSRDRRASFSNYGDQAVDVGAPGVNTLSAWMGGGYGYMNGTSMASPHVAGAAALLYSDRPAATVAQVRQSLLAGADPVSALTGLTATGARLNLRGALDELDALLPISSAVQITPPGRLTDSVRITFVQDVTAVQASNITMRVQGTPVGIGAALSCRDVGGAVAACADGAVRTATLAPAAALLPGQWYTVTVSPEGAPPVTDLEGNAIATHARTFRAATATEDVGLGTAYSWRRQAAASAFGGSYEVARSTGAWASWKGTGTSLTWWAVRGPDQGLARVLIDGSSVGTFNLWSSARRYRVPYVFKNLAAGVPHTIKVVSLGSRGSPLGTGTLVSIDAFSAGATRTDTPALTAGWQAVKSAWVSGGWYVRESLGGMKASFTFRGTGVDWYTALGPSMGLAAIYVDGVRIRDVDNYALLGKYGYRWSVRGLADRVHRVDIIPLGRKRAISAGTWIAVDKFVAV